MTFDVAIRSEALLGEGPRWDAAAQRLLWVDIEAGELHVFDPARGEDRSVALGARVGAAAPTRSGGVLVALADRLALVDLADESVQTLVELPHGSQLRSNDGACDPAGRFWVGSMALDETRDAGALYRYSAHAGLERVLSGVTLSNGLGWTPDGRGMYYIDSPSYQVDLFDFDVVTGELSGRKRFASIDSSEGVPDGLAVDNEGGVWVALYRGGVVRRYNPDGSFDRVLTLPVDTVTACCFGGEDGRSLYVTTASMGLTPAERRQQPLAGSVFVTDAGVSGPAAHPFADDPYVA